MKVHFIDVVCLCPNMNDIQTVVAWGGYTVAEEQHQRAGSDTESHLWKLSVPIDKKF